MASLELQIDTAEFTAAVRELGAGLESRDIRERFDQLLLGELQECVNGGRIGEFFQLRAVRATGTGELRIKMEPFGLLERAIAALRALTGELEIDGHEGLPSVGIEDWPPDSKRGERPS